MKKILSVMALAAVLSACSNNAKQENMVKQQAIVAIKDSLKLDSFKRADTQEKERLAKVKEEKANEEKVREEKRVLLLSERNEAAAARHTSSNSGYQNEAPVPAKKKGWSQAAKGTAIGAGAGALGGLLIDKNKGRGAIIGGVVGAGTGYVIGRSQDRKSGRVKPKVKNDQ